MEGSSGRRLLAFTITLSAPAAQLVTIRWGTVNGTATAGRDYVAAAGFVTFAPGQTQRTVGVWVLADRVREAHERFRVNLATPVNAAISPTAGFATGLIVNDDGLTRAQLAAAFATLEAFNRDAKRRT